MPAKRPPPHDASPPPAAGRVTIVGAGPGHPDFLTRKGERVLREAEVVAYDALLDQSFKFLFPQKAFKLFVGKRCGRHTLAQEDIHRLMIRHARQGKRVVRLKGGDPFVYGRGAEEWLALNAAGIAVDIIPGVSSLQAAGALAGIPLTHRGQANSVLALEGQCETFEPWHWRLIANAVIHLDLTLAIFMATRRIAAIAGHLLEHGVSPKTLVALVENASLATQTTRVVSLGRAAAGDLAPATDGPGLLYIGGGVDLRETLLATTTKRSNKATRTGNVINLGMMRP